MELKEASFAITDHYFSFWKNSLNKMIRSKPVSRMCWRDVIAAG
jgi:hypothetical protein